MGCTCVRALGTGDAYLDSQKVVVVAAAGGTVERVLMGKSLATIVILAPLGLNFGSRWSVHCSGRRRLVPGGHKEHSCKEQRKRNDMNVNVDVNILPATI